MARYIVEGPDGKRYIVEGPDGATAPAQGGSPTQAQKTASEAPIVPANPSAPFTRAGGYGAARQGINDAVIKTGLGIKSLFTDLSEDDRYALEGMRQEKAEDPERGKRIAGEIGGNVLIGAVPGAKIAGSASKLVGAGRALAPYFGTAMGAAGTEFVQHPAEGEGAGERMLQKATSAGTAAVLAPLVQLGLRGAGKVITQPFKPTPEAARLMEQGVNPTLQQGSHGKIGRFIGGLTSGAVDVKNRLRDEIANAHLARVTKGQEAMPEGTAKEFLDAELDRVAKEYSDFWQGYKVNLSPKAVKAVIQQGSKVGPNQIGAGEAVQARAALAERLGDANTNLRMNYDTYEKEIRSKLSAAMRNETNPEVQRRMGEARELLDRLVTRQGMTVGREDVLKDINVRNFDVKRLEEAITPGATAQEGVDITSLVRAYAKNLPQAAKVGNTTFDDLIAPAGRLMSTTPVQHRSRALMQAGKQLGGTALAGALVAGGAAPGAAALAPLVALSLAGQTGKGARVLMGGTEAQRRIAKILQDLGPAAQALYTGTATTKAEGEE